MDFSLTLPGLTEVFAPSNLFKTSVSVEPIKIDMIAGGASFAPNL